MIEETTELNKELLRKIEWLNTRKQYVTASSVSALDYKRAPKKIKVFGTELSNAEMDVLTNALTEYDADDAYAPSRAAAWGHSNEKSVLESTSSFYHWDDCIIVSERYDDEHKNPILRGFGCSPDGLDIPQPEGRVKLFDSEVKAKHALEVKSFGPKKHMEIVSTGEVPEEIKDQLAWYFECIPTLEDITLVLDCPKVPTLKRWAKLYTREDLRQRMIHLSLVADETIDTINNVKRRSEWKEYMMKK